MGILVISYFTEINIGFFLHVTAVKREYNGRKMDLVVDLRWQYRKMEGVREGILVRERARWHYPTCACGGSR